ncbi:hypothetical protein [Sphingomonas koreensis]|jgi:hypothetical protein|uniref:17 kDa surface antigen n=2 Tax=Sphingomonas koreensis TaxID=93064 RepID=A0AAJ4V956_9SPHN|nr:hypothetical protein [Sphingomonas koreensis]MDC7809625.1 hypothetical protein [Sphingomonas koreensis]PJI90823.1 hypothetical protein BDW16_4172 [Sphingomonas koreensis]RSU24233.1 hypothetical protein CA224_00355 [Sphingomonas koreensis]RSU25935.1 hypothetical protein CA222_10685 [Sphingomonas koreensis]RSU26011.1 hypothetical protein CA222_11130 [Sphingomonas koreensis]
MTKRMTKGIATLALMATVLTPIAVAAQENDLQGIRSSRGDSELQRRGYKLEKRSGDSQFWWNSRTDTCIRVNVWRGRYESISSASKSDCGKGGPSAGVVVGAAVAIGLIAALASKKDKGPDYKRGYDDGLNGNPYDRRGNDRYREGYQAGETEAQKRPDPQRDPEFKRGYDDGLYGRAYDRRGNDRYREGYRVGQDEARRPDPQRDPEYKRGYDDGLYGRAYDRRGNDRYREGYRAGQDEARRPDDRGSLRNVPQAARDACARRADEDLNARRGTSVPVSARELNRSEWEIVVETGRERSRCTVDSRGYVRSLTAY